MQITIPSHDIKCISVDSFKNQNFQNKKSETWTLENLKTINFLIGGNNSGKSRLIRHLYNNKISDIDCYSYSQKNILELIISNANIIDSKNITDENTYKYDDLDKDKINNIISEISKGIKTLESDSIKKIIEELYRTIRYSIRSNNNGETSSTIELYFEKLYLKGVDESEYSRISDFDDKIFNKVYIPILRNLRPLVEKIHLEKINKELLDEEGDLYFDDLNLNRTLKDYKLNEDTYIIDERLNTISKNTGPLTNTIFTGYSIYNDIVNLLLSGHDTRILITEYEKYLSSNFFDRQQVTLTPKLNEDVIYIKIGNQKERPIYELGDGLQTIIIITFPIFTATKPTFFYIEEPETHLHAGQQRALINSLADKKEHQYFITTHSNHFIDLIQERDDVSIHRVFQVPADNNNVITCIDSLAKDVEILDDLGVRASSVLLANCSIWIEGITDKLYLRSYMKKYIDELKENSNDEEKSLNSFKENLHYIFTEYQGSNINHWHFGDNDNTNDDTTSAKRLSTKAFLLADGDIIDKGNRVEKLRKHLGDNLLILKHKEIENYIPESILKDASQELWETFNKKNKATFIANDIKQNDYANMEGIGRYLEKFVTCDSNERKFFEDRSGTIKDKVKLCRIAVRLMNERDDWKLTNDLKNICENIYNHIKKSNFNKI